MPPQAVGEPIDLPTAKASPPRGLDRIPKFRRSDPLPMRPGRDRRKFQFSTMVYQYAQVKPFIYINLLGDLEPARFLASNAGFRPGVDWISLGVEATPSTSFRRG
jgi:hypothetical protein